MTKEELEREAEEYANQSQYTDYDNPSLSESLDISQDIKNAYIAGAESREKQIAELEMTVGTLRTFSNEQATCIERLEKENAELKEQIKQIEKVSDYNADQFAKATEIIKDLCGMVRELNKPNVQLTNVDYSLADAEQFLKEIEK